MAALGKIRKRGVTLIIIIGLGLFAFIAEEFVRSCETQGNERRQQVGEVLGKKISVQDFQALVDEYQEVIKLTQGRDNLTEEELNQVKDMVWQTYVSNALMEDEADKLGLTVTDEELQNVLREGTNSMLMQSPFVNQQTGRFDASMLTKFLDEYKKMNAAQNPQQAEQYKKLYDYWRFIEKSLRQNLLAQKYQGLLSHSLLSNPVSAKMAFEGQNTESDILLASIAYSTINDNKVEVSDADLKAKYKEEKEMFKQIEESRDIKYVDFQVVPSTADRKAIIKSMDEASKQLSAGADPAEVVRKGQSQVAYTGLAVTRKALPTDIAARIDSMGVGQTSQPFETKFDNTINVVKLIAKTELPDSVEYQAIQVAGADAAAYKKSADSIYAAVKAGAAVDSIAKKYGQTGSKQWLTSSMYENSQSVDADSKKLLETLQTLPAGEVANVAFAQGNMIVKVTARKALVTKYTAAVVKHTIDFSKDTYSQAYNKFSQFVSENQTLEAMEKNAAKYGFNVQERKSLSSSEHYVAGVRGTRDAMKWIFDAKENQISPLYECGNNDHLFVVCLTKIHPVGYLELDDVKDAVKQEVLRDKKFEQLKEKLASVKSIADAKGKGANVDTLKQVTFAAPAFVQGASEPALSGAVAATKQGKLSDHVVKGNAGAYVFQVLNQAQRSGAKFDDKQAEAGLRMQAQQAASRYMSELYQNAKVVDNRYLFF